MIPSLNTLRPACWISATLVPGAIVTETSYSPAVARLTRRVVRHIEAGDSAVIRWMRISRSYKNSAG